MRRLAPRNWNHPAPTSSRSPLQPVSQAPVQAISQAPASEAAQYAAQAGPQPTDSQPAAQLRPLIDILGSKQTPCFVSGCAFKGSAQTVHDHIEAAHTYDDLNLGRPAFAQLQKQELQKQKHSKSSDFTKVKVHCQLPCCKTQVSSQLARCECASYAYQTHEGLS